MKEINDLLTAYRIARENNQQAILATVVKVEGSSYRRPGARMLVTEDGKLTGAISGGCLEGDARKKALLALHQQKNKLVTYDTSIEGEAELAVQLGCNGIVHILFEYIDSDKPNNPISLLEEVQKKREEAVIVTLFSTNSKLDQQGTLFVSGENLHKSSVELDSSYLSDALLMALKHKKSFIKRFDELHHEALIEYVSPTINVVIFGGGNDVKPLVEAVNIIGWQSTVMDGRVTYALPERFPKAKATFLTTPENAFNHIVVDPFTVFVLMTHNYPYDLAVLKTLLHIETPYVGILGPKKKLDKMFSDLLSSGYDLTKEQKSKIYGPIGLDIGAETSEEIAISIVSEIKAVLAKRGGNSLKFLAKKIHEDISIIL